MTKICFKCKLPKIKSDFSDAQFIKKSGWCKLCISLSKKSYYQDNKERIINSSKEYQEIHKEEVLEYKREYYLENKNTKLSYNKSYYEDNRTQIIAASKQYYEDNKEQVMIYRKEYQKARRKTDPAFKLRAILSNAIGFSIKKNGSVKNHKSVVKFLPYTMGELKQHLEKQFEPWMNWNNHGNYDLKSWDDNDSSTWKWNVDHIAPHRNFSYTSMEDQAFKDCWALSNLRPYSAKQNLIDGDRK